MTDSDKHQDVGAGLRQSVHDLRSPLNSLLLVSQRASRLISEGCMDSGSLTDSWSVVTAATAELKDSVERLAALSRSIDGVDSTLKDESLKDKSLKDKSLDDPYAQASSGTPGYVSSRPLQNSEAPDNRSDFESNSRARFTPGIPSRDRTYSRQVLFVASGVSQVFVTASVLKNHGFQVRVIEDPGEIVSAFADDQEYNLICIVVDEAVPSVCETVAQLRQVERVAPIFALVNNITSEGAKRLLASGANECVELEASAESILARVLVQA